jgi:hypothetical protein
MMEETTRWSLLLPAAVDTANVVECIECIYIWRYRTTGSRLNGKAAEHVYSLFLLLAVSLLLLLLLLLLHVLSLLHNKRDIPPKIHV